MYRFILCLSLLLLCPSANAQQSSLPADKFQQILNRTADQKNIFGVTVQVVSGENSWSGSAGNLKNESPYFIASTTKLYVTACIMKLRSEGKLKLDDSISRYLPADIMDKLHVYEGTDYSQQITIRHLLSHTSGLPDYFQQKQTNGKSLEDELTSGKDRHWTFEESIVLSKKMKPRFRPGEKGKAFYSDTNFQLLGRIIEIITGKKIAEVFNEMIINPLGLKKTYLYADPSDTTPVCLYFKKNPLLIPKAMTSFGPDGGIVSTAGESMIFIRAFYSGKLFPKEYLDEMQNWNRIFPPLESGTGMLHFGLPGYMTGGKGAMDLIGHSGLSGAFAFYCPQKNAFITGTVNQIDRPQTSYRMISKILLAI